MTIDGEPMRDGELAAGALTTWLADSGARVTAIDVSPEMVRLATDRLGDRARILNADLVEPLDFATDAIADLVVASLVMHYLADWTGPLDEFYRVLKPDGAMVFSTHHPAMDWQQHSRGDFFKVMQVTETWPKGGQPYEVTFWRRPLTRSPQPSAAPASSSTGWSSRRRCGPPRVR